MRTKKNIGVAQEVADDEAKKVVRTEETLTRHIYRLCNEKTNYELQNEFFARFYLKAFPEKLESYINGGWFDDTYCEEWIGRFMKGTPTIYMDGNTLQAYFEVAISWNQYRMKLVREVN